MSYINKKSKVFLERPEIPFVAVRSEARMKNYSSSTDTRAWSDIVEDRRQHILEYAAKNKEGHCMDKSFPLESLLAAMMACKNCEMRKIQRKIDYLDKLLGIYSQISLTPDQQRNLDDLRTELQKAYEHLLSLECDQELTTVLEPRKGEGEPIKSELDTGELAAELDTVEKKLSDELDTEGQTVEELPSDIDTAERGEVEELAEELDTREGQSEGEVTGEVDAGEVQIEEELAGEDQEQAELAAELDEGQVEEPAVEVEGEEGEAEEVPAEELAVEEGEAVEEEEAAEGEVVEEGEAVEGEADAEKVEGVEEVTPELVEEGEEGEEGEEAEEGEGKEGGQVCAAPCAGGIEVDQGPPEQAEETVEEPEAPEEPEPELSVGAEASIGGTMSRVLSGEAVGVGIPSVTISVSDHNIPKTLSAEILRKRLSERSADKIKAPEKKVCKGVCARKEPEVVEESPEEVAVVQDLTGEEKQEAEAVVEETEEAPEPQPTVEPEAAPDIAPAEEITTVEETVVEEEAAAVPEPQPEEEVVDTGVIEVAVVDTETKPEVVEQIATEAPEIVEDTTIQEPAPVEVITTEQPVTVEERAPPEPVILQQVAAKEEIDASTIPRAVNIEDTEVVEVEPQVAAIPEPSLTPKPIITPISEMPVQPLEEVYIPRAASETHAVDDEIAAEIEEAAPTVSDEMVATDTVETVCRSVCAEEVLTRTTGVCSDAIQSKVAAVQVTTSPVQPVQVPVQVMVQPVVQPTAAVRQVAPAVPTVDERRGSWFGRDKDTDEMKAEVRHKETSEAAISTPMLIKYDESTETPGEPREKRICDCMRKRKASEKKDATGKKICKGPCAADLRSTICRGPCAADLPSTICKAPCAAGLFSSICKGSCAAGLLSSICRGPCASGLPPSGEDELPTSFASKDEEIEALRKALAGRKYSARYIPRSMLEESRTP